LIPWITIETFVNGKDSRVRLCGTHGYIRMMELVVLFRDIEKQQLETV
jgi:hypothetical protein